MESKAYNKEKIDELKARKASLRAWARLELQEELDDSLLPIFVKLDQHADNFKVIVSALQQRLESLQTQYESLLASYQALKATAISTNSPVAAFWHGLAQNSWKLVLSIAFVFSTGISVGMYYHDVYAYREFLSTVTKKSYPDGSIKIAFTPAKGKTLRMGKDYQYVESENKVYVLVKAGN